MCVFTYIKEKIIHLKLVIFNNKKYLAALYCIAQIKYKRNVKCVTCFIKSFFIKHFLD